MRREDWGEGVGVPAGACRRVRWRTPGRRRSPRARGQRTGEGTGGDSAAGALPRNETRS
jgi:hypothetical protein